MLQEYAQFGGRFSEDSRLSPLDRLIRFPIFRAIGFNSALCRITGCPMDRNRSQRVSKLCKYRSSQSQLIVVQTLCKQ